MKYSEKISDILFRPLILCNTDLVSTVAQILGKLHNLFNLQFSYL